MRLLLILFGIFTALSNPVLAADEGQGINTELIFRSPLRDVIDDGQPLNLDSKEKVDLASRMAAIEEKLISFEKMMLDLLDQVKKNNGRIDAHEEQIVAIEKEITLLKEQQKLTRIALQEADKKVGEMEVKVAAMEKRVAEVTAWAQQIWNQAQGVLSQAQQTLAYAQQADAAARPSGLIGGLLSLIPGLGHR